LEANLATSFVSYVLRFAGLAQTNVQNTICSTVRNALMLVAGVPKLVKK
jgi:hypothetical protein